MLPSDDRRLEMAVAARDAETLVHLFTAAGDHFEAAGDIDAACFHLTQAYIWALEAGDPAAQGLHARLKARGREE